MRLRSGNNDSSRSASKRWSRSSISVMEFVASESNRHPPRPFGLFPLPSTAEPARLRQRATMRICALVLLLASSACGGGAGDQPADPDPTPTPGGGGTTLTVTDLDLQYCVQVINATNGGGIAFAENEIPWWNGNEFHGIRDIVDQGEGLFWGEGPGGPLFNQ